MEKYKAYYNITSESVIGSSFFIDDEMWCDYEAEDFEIAKHIALASILAQLMEMGRIVTKVELIRIEQNGKILKRFLKPELVN